MSDYEVDGFVMGPTPRARVLALRIETDGTVQRIDRPLIQAANEEFDGQVDIVSANLPLLPITSRPWVMAVHEWGTTNGMTINPLAWACYGRSALFGPAFIALDSDDEGNSFDIPEYVIRMLETPMDEWMPPQALATIRAGEADFWAAQ